MTDKKSTELCEKLTERGVDWLDESNGYADVTTFIANGAKWTVISKSYLNPEHNWMTLRAEHITPEQAIAATLGSEREKALEELVRDMSAALIHDNCYRWCEAKEPCNLITDGKCQYRERIRELGIEVVTDE